MDSYIACDSIDNIEIRKFQKMVFVYNALEDGWTITKIGDNYIFKKKHHNDKEIFLDSYLNQFIKKNCGLKHITVTKTDN